MTKDNNTFEEAMLRLEEIINLVNSGKVSLDNSLQLYEEADRLMEFCQKKISSVEQRIEELIKKHDMTCFGENDNDDELINLSS